MLLSVGLLLFVWAVGVVLGAGVSRFQAARQKEQAPDVLAAPDGAPIPLCFHVLPGSEGELVGAAVGSGVEGAVCEGRAGGDESLRLKDFYGWCVGVKQAVRRVVEEDEEFVLLAVRSLENAFYCFLCQPTIPRSACGLFEDTVRKVKECNEQGKDEPGGGKDADEVHPVHVFVAVCPQLVELRRQAGREVEEYPCYADGGCELFVGKEFFGFAEVSHEVSHGGSVTGSV